MQVQQRCTCVWTNTAQDLRIRNLPISNPVGELKPAKDGDFPLKSSIASQFKQTTNRSRGAVRFDCIAGSAFVFSGARLTSEGRRAAASPAR